MKKSFGLLFALLALASAASASDITQRVGNRTLLKTNRTAQCATTSGHLSKECAHLKEMQVSQAKRF